MDSNNTLMSDREKLVMILDELIPSKEFDSKTKLSIVGSDSLKALALVSTVEEEWDISIPDDEINSEFFTDFGYIIGCIERSKGTIATPIND